jgi:hypothetical protein
MRRDCSCLAFGDDKPDQCENCRYFACLGCTYPQAGVCLRHAPSNPTDLTGLFPRMERSDWCGDYNRRAPRTERQA